MKFLFQAEMADIEKTQWQSFKMEFKTLFTFLDTWVIWPFLKCLESTFFSVFIYIIKDTTFVKPYISHYLSAKIFFFISDTGNWKDHEIRIWKTIWRRFWYIFHSHWESHRISLSNAHFSLHFLLSSSTHLNNQNLCFCAASWKF